MRGASGGGRRSRGWGSKERGKRPEWWTTKQARNSRKVRAPPRCCAGKLPAKDREGPAKALAQDLGAPARLPRAVRAVTPAPSGPARQATARSQATMLRRGTRRDCACTPLQRNRAPARAKLCLMRLARPTSRGTQPKALRGGSRGHSSWPCAGCRSLAGSALVVGCRAASRARARRTHLACDAREEDPQGERRRC